MPNKRKRKRGEKAYRALRGSNGYLKGGMCDLDVPIVLAKNKGSSLTAKSNTKGNGKTPATPWRGCAKEQLALVERLESTGYSTIALSHVVHGGDVSDSDHAEKAIPDEIFDSGSNNRNDTSSSSGKSTTKRSKARTKLKILKRLNVVMEQESNLADFNYNNEKTKGILQSYDLIAFSPRNETVLSAICNSTAQHLFYLDVITLDYTAGRGGVQLPFRLKPTHVTSASKQGLALELPYGPAIIDPSKRKGFVQAARQLANACFKVRNVKPPPRIIVSSGCRVLNGTGKDYGAMVLRSAGDILNFCRVVLGFEERLVHRVMNTDAWLTIQKGKDRKNGKITSSTFDIMGSDGDSKKRLGERGIATISFRLRDEDDSDNDGDGDSEEPKKNEEVTPVDVDTKKDEPDDADDDDDGFLRL